MHFLFLKKINIYLENGFVIERNGVKFGLGGEYSGYTEYF